MLTLDDQPGIAEIEWVPGERDRKALHRRAMALLSAIVTQARLDGMSKIRLKARQGERPVMLDYFGPRADPAARWWDMSPPPFECYPHLVQAALSCAALEEGLPLRGQVSAQLRGRAVNIRFALPTVEELTLTIED